LQYRANRKQKRHRECKNFAIKSNILSEKIAWPGPEPVPVPAPLRYITSGSRLFLLLSLFVCHTVCNYFWQSQWKWGENCM